MVRKSLGHYKIIRQVGSGGMGEVYAAEDPELNRQVAFKMVRPDPSAPKEAPAPDTPLQVTPPSRDMPDGGHHSFEDLSGRIVDAGWEAVRAHYATARAT